MMSLVSKTADQSAIALGWSAAGRIELSNVAFRCKYEHQYGETRGGNDKERHWFKNISPQPFFTHRSALPGFVSHHNRKHMVSPEQ